MAIWLGQDSNKQKEMQNYPSKLAINYTYAWNLIINIFAENY